MSMKKIFVFVLLSFFAMGASGAWAVYQGEIPGEDKIVQINETNFPDPKFRAYVRAHFDDGGHSGTHNPAGDGWLGGNELVSASRLNLNDVFSDDVSAVTNESIQGLEKLTYLIELRLSGTSITSLNVSSLIYLEKLYCWYNPSLKTLNVSACTRLEDLICNNCVLEGTLDLSNNTSLGDLECFNNPELKVVLPKTTDAYHGAYGGVRSIYAYNIKNIGPLTLTKVGTEMVNILSYDVLGSNLRSFYISGLTGSMLTAVDFSHATGVERVEMNNIANLASVTFGSASSLSTFRASNTKLGTGIVTLLADAGADGKLSTLELVNVGGAKTVDLSGFTNLTTLNLSSNDLTAVALPDDLTQLWGNVTLNLSNNALTSLTVPTGTTHLILTNNNFTTLPALPESVTLLEIGGNKFTYLPTIPTTVTDLDISNFGLTEVDLSGLTNLQVLIASDNDFTTLDLTASTHLHDVSVDGNKNMTSINLDGLTEVKRVNISGTKIPLSNVPKIVGYLYANGMDESFFGSEGAVDLSQHTNVFVLYMNDNGENFKYLTIAPSDTGFSQEYRLANNGLQSVNLPADACWVTLDNNHLTTLELAQCTHLEEISFEGQTYPGTYALVENLDGWSMNMSDIVGSENLSKVSDVKAYDFDHNPVTATSSGGVYVFSAVPSTVTYNYDTGGKMRYTGDAVLMGVTIATAAPEPPTPAPAAPVLTPSSQTLNLRPGVAITPLTITATSGATISEWSISSGSLPTGLTGTPSSDNWSYTISGTPDASTAGQTFEALVTATNSIGEASATLTFYITGSDTPDTPSTPENPGTNTGDNTGSGQTNNNATDDTAEDESGGGSAQTNVTTTAEGFSAMSDTQKQAVTTLKLTGVISNLATLIQTSQNLNTLDLTGAVIDDVALDSNSAPKLDVINLTGNTQVQTVAITNGVLKNLLIAGCSSLRTLSCPRNSLMALDLNDLSSLQEASFSGQTRSGVTLSENMNFSDFIESAMYASGHYYFEVAFSPEKVKNLKAYDASGNEISATYSNGSMTFAKIPAKFQYDYDTGFNNTLMDVTVSSSNGSSGGNSDNNDEDLSSSGGGCDFGFGALIGLSLISVLIKKKK